MRLEYSIIDVFTNTCFGGNQLAVVWADDTLPDDAMQSIAAEFNLAETIFLIPPLDPDNHAAARIFTPKTELRFAGHPTVGASYAIGKAAQIFGKPVKSSVRLEQRVGVVSADLIENEGAIEGAHVASPEPLHIGEKVAVETVAQAVSLDPSDIDFSGHEPVICTCGNALVYVRLKDRDALERAEANLNVFKAHLPRETAIGVHLYTPSRRDDLDYEARMFAPMVGVPEDPATGAANLSLAGLLATLDAVQTGTLNYRVAQGEKMGRPSILFGTAKKVSGALDAFSIGGNCVDVGRGILTLPDQKSDELN